MVIGEQAQDNPGLLKRYVREGHEIGNHTFTHPDISEISHAPAGAGAEPDRAPLRRETGCSRSISGRRTRSIRSRTPTTRPRPPIALSRWATPSSATRSTPTTGMSIRARRRRRSPTTYSQQLCASMKDRPWFRGSIILMHDGGGDRSATVAALPLLITTLRAKGLRICSGLGADGQDHRRSHAAHFAARCAGRRASTRLPSSSSPSSATLL